MQLKVHVNSAYDLKNVNWRHGDLQPYAVAWIDSSAKCSTKVDMINGVNPVWEEQFTIPLLSTSRLETAILYVEIVHVKPAPGTKPLIGSTKLPLRVALSETRTEGKAVFSLVLERPSGRPQGSVEIKIKVKDSMPLPHQLHHRPQPQPRYQPNQMNRYPNMPGSVTLGYPVNSPQNLRPAVAQVPRNAVHPSTMRPQYRPVNPQPSIGRSLCALALGISPNQLGDVMGFSRQMAQRATIGLVNNNGFLGNGTNGTNDSSHTMEGGASNEVGCDNGAFSDAQFGIDGGLGNGELDFGGIFSNGGFDLGGLDISGLDFGGVCE